MPLYSDPTDPASHAVRFVLAEKAVNIEIYQVVGDDRPDELRELNPYDEILTLVDRDLVLYDTQVILEYLDERFPHPPLMPVDPVTRANNRLYRHRIQRDLYSLCETLQAGASGAAGTAARKSLRDQLCAIAPAFEQKPFFISDEYTLVDCLFAPVLWRLPSLQVKLPPSCKALNEYGSRMFERETFRSSLSDQEREMALA